MSLIGATMSGEGGAPFFGTGPGLDFGDFFGPNSVFSVLGQQGPAGFPSVTAPGFVAPGTVAPGGGAAPGGNGACVPGPFLPSARTGFRAQAFPTCVPGTNRTVWFKPAGKPVLWSDDLAACKRVSRVAARANKARPRRRGRR